LDIEAKVFEHDLRIKGWTRLFEIRFNPVNPDSDNEDV